MTAEELAEALADMLRSLAEDEDEDGGAIELHGAKIESYRRAGVLTSDAGFVVELKDGSEFQVAVTQSRIGHDQEDDT